MKIRTLSVLAGVGAPLILTAGASAAFVGIKAVGKENAFGIIVVNVYAEYDRPGDLFSHAGGTVDAPLLIQVLGGGTFYNHSFGGDIAPSANLVVAFPSLAYDTFVTIGLKVNSNAFPDALLITPGFPTGITGTQLFTNESGWAVTPDDAQGDPFNPDYVAGNGQVLIAQFATADGTGFSGTMLVGGVSNGVAQDFVVSFFYVVPAPGALALLGAAGLVGASRRRCHHRNSP